jgi:hypothetical protein
MNLHINDKELFENLKNATLYKTIIGSKMYQVDDINSDTDYLYIYVPSISERNCFYPSHHQLQYKENGIDYNFVNIFTFLKNCLVGDSTINFEIIHDENIKNSSLYFLSEMRYAFHNYKIIRSYNGLARRDLRELRKQTSDFDKNKKIYHAFRGHNFSKMILEKNFNPLNKDDLNSEIFKIKSLKDWEERQYITESLKTDIENFRKHISELYNSNTFTFPDFMSIENQTILDKHMSNLINSDIWKKKSDWVMDMKLFYDANENVEIKYE